MDSTFDMATAAETAFCHVVTVVSDRCRAKTGYQTRRIHLLLTYFGQLVATSQLVSGALGSNPTSSKIFGGLDLLDFRPDHGVGRPWFYGNYTA